MWITLIFNGLILKVEHNFWKENSISGGRILLFGHLNHFLDVLFHFHLHQIEAGQSVLGRIVASNWKNLSKQK